MEAIVSRGTTEVVRNGASFGALMCTSQAKREESEYRAPRLGSDAAPIPALVVVKSVLRY
jgi:hypothetical protein